jgi:hypothetical protein
VRLVADVSMAMLRAHEEALTALLSVGSLISTGGG